MRKENRKILSPLLLFLTKIEISEDNNYSI